MIYHRAKKTQWIWEPYGVLILAVEISGDLEGGCLGTVGLGEGEELYDAMKTTLQEN